MATSTVPGDGDPGPRRLLGRAVDPIVRAVGRVPASVLTKLLVAFFGTVFLLVVLGVLGLGVISESNARVVTLGTLQQRATAYRQVQAGVAAIQQVVKLRAYDVSNGPFADFNFSKLFSTDGRLVTDELIEEMITVQSGPRTLHDSGSRPPARTRARWGKSHRITVGSPTR